MHALCMCTVCVLLQVDDEMRVLLANLKDLVEAERAAKSGKKGKKKKKAKGKGKKKKGAEKNGKKKKDPTVCALVHMVACVAACLT